jgi:hypothetical protein
VGATDDIKDPVFKAGLDEADRFLDEGDYAAASKKCAETYLLLLEEHPELIPEPGSVPGAHFPTASGSNQSLRVFAGARAARGAFWPVTGSIQVLVDENRRPSLSYSKERFSFSEAAGYYEFLVGQVRRLQQAD